MIDLKRIKDIDWDFQKSKTNTSTNSIHPYPAKYIPQIPNNLIRIFSEEGDTVYDPFLGSGTTCLEANILKRDAIGNDVNELAVLISKVKTNHIEPKTLSQLEVFLSNLSAKIDVYYKENININTPKIPRIELWFEKFVIDEISIIKTEISKIGNNKIKDFCYVALSAIIVNVSKQDSDTRYVRVKKNINPVDVFNKFSKQLNKMSKVMEENYKSLQYATTKVKVADSREDNIFSENSADFAVTSPPYPNAYDYHLYHKYRLFWLDMNPFDLKKNEIGAHAHYSKPNGLDEFDFQKDMETCFLRISKILKPNKYFALVIGDSILKGRSIENNAILKQASKETPFIFEIEVERNLNLQKKSFNPRIGKIKTEKIMIFKNIK